MPYGPASILGDVLRNKRAEAVVRKHLTGIVNAPLEIQLRYAPLERVVGFLRRILEEAPGNGIDPLPSDWDVPTGGVEGRYHLTYFGFGQPRRRTFAMAPGIRYEAEVIDTWNMTVTRLPGTYEGVFTLPLPALPYIAVRLRAYEDTPTPATTAG
ncbi:DUF5605 domain-containing protein [Streptomyces sp. NPDC047061]|uniref:DUF5605 domain-containing protein n=1 Tax=Streptomyces sp. NPDC047061 TaxID=3154605 RepID=UPI0033C9F7E7